MMAAMLMGHLQRCGMVPVEGRCWVVPCVVLAAGKWMMRGLLGMTSGTQLGRGVLGPWVQAAMVAVMVTMMIVSPPTEWSCCQACDIPRVGCRRQWAGSVLSCGAGAKRVRQRSGGPEDFGLFGDGNSVHEYQHRVCW